MGRLGGSLARHAAPGTATTRCVRLLGDSFAAAFTFALGRGGTVADAAALGAEAGARALARVGVPVRLMRIVGGA